MSYFDPIHPLSTVCILKKVWIFFIHFDTKGSMEGCYCFYWFCIHSKILQNAVETCMKEHRFFFDSLNRSLIKWLLFQIPACKVLDKVLIYTVHLDLINAVFQHKNSEELLRILKNSLGFVIVSLG